MKKPTKKDNSINDKKAEKMNQIINDLEEKFFTEVSKDDDIHQIKQRGAHYEDHSHPSAV